MVQRRDPPIVVAIALGRGRDEALAVRRPVEFVDIGVGRRDELQRAAFGGNDGDALLVVGLADLADLGGARFHRAGHLVRAHGRQKRDARTIRREAQIVGDARERRSGARLAVLHDIERRLARLAVRRDEGEHRARRRPRRVGIAARLARIERAQHMPVRAAQHHRAMRVVGQIARIGRLDVDDAVALGRQRQMIVVADDDGG